MKKVFISGTAMISSGGIGTSDVWNAVLNQNVIVKKRNYRLYDGTDIEYPVYPMPEISLRDWMTKEKYSWIAKEGLTNDKDFVLMFVSASLALSNANLKNGENVALIIGHENVGVNNLINKVLQGQPPSENQPPVNSFNEYKSDYFKLQTFPHLFYLAKALELNGAHFIINNACASGLHAVELGSCLIKNGQAERAVIVCSDYAHVTEHMWLSEKGFSSKKGVIRPFDKDRDGSVLGDGAAAVVLESEQSVINRKSEAFCEYLGSRFRHDNWKVNLPDVTSHQYSKTIREVINIYDEEIDLLIPHGAGIPLWDKYESREILNAFKDKKVPTVTALKGYFGHTLGANSLLELCAGIQCMLSNTVPLAYNFSNEDSGIDLPIEKRTIKRQVNTLLKTVSAYGGFNAATLIRKV